MWQDSLEDLIAKGSTAFDLLRLLAFLAADPVPIDILADRAGQLPATSVPESLFAAAPVAELTDAGLLVAAPDGVAVPAELAAAVRDRLDLETRRRSCDNATTLLSDALPDDSTDIRNWPAWEPLLPHALAVVGHAEALGVADTPTVSLLERAAAHLATRGQPTPARELTERALANPRLDEDSALAGRVRRTHGTVLAALGELGAAQAEFEHALAIHRGAVGIDSLEVGQDLTELASVLAASNQTDAARKEAELAVATLDGQDTPVLILTEAYRALAWAQLQSREPNAARQEYERALELLERECGADHPATAGTRGGLGLALEALGQLAAGKAELEQALHLEELALGPDHPNVAITHSNLATALDSIGDLAGARRHLEQALEIGQRMLPASHPGLQIRHLKLATVLQKLDDLDGALHHRQEALTIVEGARGPGDPEVADYREWLATSLRDLGDLRAARTELEHAVRIRERVHGPAHLSVVRSRLALAELLTTLGDESAAIYELLEDAENAENARSRARAGLIDAFERELARDVDDDALPAIAGACIDSGALELARTALQRARPEVATGSDDPTAQQLGRVWHRLGRAFGKERRDEALAAYEAALQLLEDRPRYYGIVLHDIADARRAQGRMDEAVGLYRRAVTCKREVGNLRELAITLTVLGLALMELGDAVAAREAAVEASDLLRRCESDERFLLGTTLVLTGRASAATGDREAAVGQLEEGHQLLIDSGALATVVAAVTGRLIAAYDELGRDDDARRVLETELERNENAEAFPSIAAACIDSGALSHAEHGLERATARLDDGQDDAARQQVGAGWHRLGRAYGRAERRDDALTAYEAALPLLTEDPQYHGVALHDIGDIRRAQGRTEEAVELYRQAVERKQAAGEAGTARDLATSLLALGRASETLGQVVDALGAYEERLKILTSLAEKDPQAEGVTLHDIGDVRLAQNRIEEAIACYRQAVERKRDAGDAASPRGLAASLLALGRTLDRNGDHVEALPVYEQRLETLAGLPERDHQAEGVTLHDIAGTMLAQNRVDDAIGFYRRAVEQKRAAGESGTPFDLATTLLALGRALERNNDYPAALEAYEQRLEILTSLTERDPHAEGVTLHDIGDVRLAQNRIEEAIACYRQAVERKREGSDRVGKARDLAVSLLGLGRALEEQRDYAAALEAYEQRLEILTSLTERDPHAEGVTLHDIGDVRLAQGHHEEAIACYRQAVERKREGNNAVGSALTQIVLAETLFAADELEQARQAAEQATNTLRGEGDVDPSPLSHGLTILAEATLETGDAPKAIELFEEVDRLRSTMPTLDPLEQAGTKALIAAAYKAGGNLERASDTRDQVDAALEEAIARDPGPDEVESLLSVGTLCVAAGALTSARRAVDHVRSLAAADEASVRPGDIADVLLVLGRAQEEATDYADALATYEQRLELLTSLPEPDLEAEGVTLCDIGDVWQARERSDEAAETYGQAIDRMRQAAASPGDLAAPLLGFSVAKLAQGETEAAGEAVSEAIVLLRQEKDQDPDDVLTALVLSAKIALSRDDPATAVEQLEEAHGLLGTAPEKGRASAVEALLAEAHQRL